MRLSGEATFPSHWPSLLLTTPHLPHTLHRPSPPSHSSLPFPSSPFAASLIPAPSTVPLYLSLLINLAPLTAHPPPSPSHLPSTPFPFTLQPVTASLHSFIASYLLSLPCTAPDYLSSLGSPHYTFSTPSSHLPAPSLPLAALHRPSRPGSNELQEVL